MSARYFDNVDGGGGDALLEVVKAAPVLGEGANHVEHVLD